MYSLYSFFKYENKGIKKKEKKRKRRGHMPTEEITMYTKRLRSN